MTVTCLVLATLCHVRVVLAGFTWVPPETEVGYLPLFALGVSAIHWWRQDDATRRYADHA
ncbi:hypothetical protein [Ruania zhangjianzhongii]|uniref:hypothetical protein n=1 Tax=Ruania zhangjianzhongii TaxID=2603206 RepID=UPI0011CAC984|nr:hypothetical protein [Ruania zhangjianzhongii]